MSEIKIDHLLIEISVGQLSIPIRDILLQPGVKFSDRFVKVANSQLVIGFDKELCDFGLQETHYQHYTTAFFTALNHTLSIYKQEHADEIKKRSN